MKRKDEPSDSSKQSKRAADESARIMKIIEMAEQAVPEPAAEESPKTFRKEEWPESHGKDSHASLQKELNWLGYESEEESSEEKE